MLLGGFTLCCSDVCNSSWLGYYSDTLMTKVNKLCFKEILPFYSVWLDYDFSGVELKVKVESSVLEEDNFMFIQFKCRIRGMTEVLMERVNTNWRVGNRLRGRRIHSTTNIWLLIGNGQHAIPVKTALFRVSLSSATSFTPPLLPPWLQLVCNWPICVSHWSDWWMRHQPLMTSVTPALHTRRQSKPQTQHGCH